MKVVNVPGSNVKHYQVIIRRDSGLSTEVNLIVNNQIIAPDWKAQHISYHAMAALEVAAKESGYKIVWFANRGDAMRYANFGGKVMSVKNFNNPNVYEWFVMESE